MSQNTQSMQNLNFNQHQAAYGQQSNQNSQNMISPTYKVSSMATKTNKKVVPSLQSYKLLDITLILIFIGRATST